MPRTPYKVDPAESLNSRAVRMISHIASARASLQIAVGTVTHLARCRDRAADLATARVRMDNAAIHLANCIADLADIQAAADVKYLTSSAMTQARMSAAA